MVAGYCHPGYAESLSGYGIPWHLAHCGGSILVRKIAGVQDSDGMGCYPLFTCQDWTALHLDLAEVSEDLLTLTLVTDPFGDYELDYLRSHFDLVAPFKEHFVADLSYAVTDIVRREWRKNSRQARRRGIFVERWQRPLEFLDEWVSLYGCLVDRHRIRDIRAFSRQAFAGQLSVPGTVLFVAYEAEAPIAGHIWYVSDEIAYSHLSACAKRGYEVGAAYALYWTAIHYFREVGAVRWLDHGGGLGSGNGQDGLAGFKRGWSTGTRTSYLCGRVFDRRRYEELVGIRGVRDTDYFPAYREGEYE